MLCKLIFCAASKWPAWRYCRGLHWFTARMYSGNRSRMFSVRKCCNDKQHKWFQLTLVQQFKLGCTTNPSVTCRDSCEYKAPWSLRSTSHLCKLGKLFIFKILSSTDLLAAQTERALKCRGNQQRCLRRWRETWGGELLQTESRCLIHHCSVGYTLGGTPVENQPEFYRILHYEWSKQEGEAWIPLQTWKK